MVRRCLKGHQVIDLLQTFSLLHLGKELDTETSTLQKQTLSSHLIVFHLTICLPFASLLSLFNKISENSSGSFGNVGLTPKFVLPCQIVFQTWYRAGLSNILPFSTTQCSAFNYLGYNLLLLYGMCCTPCLKTIQEIHNCLF